MPFPGRKEMENMDMVVLHLHLPSWPSWPSRPSQAHLGDVWRQVGSAAVLASKYGHPAIWLYPMQQLGKQFWCPMKRAILLAATSTHPLVTIISYLSWNSIYSVSVWPFNFQRTSLHYIMSTRVSRYLQVPTSFARTRPLHFYCPTTLSSQFVTIDIRKTIRYLTQLIKPKTRIWE